MKILVVDDERRIREGVKAIIDYQALGCEIVGEAVNGLEAIDSIQSLKPDLCIIDIKMPLINGIEVIEEITGLGLKTKFILLTGFGEFEYAKRAMTCGVVDYLLKPIDEQVLEDKVKVYKAEYEAALRQNEREQMSKMWYKNVYMLKWLYGQELDIVTLNNHLELSLPWQNYQLVLIRPDGVEDMMDPGFRTVVKACISQSYVLIEQREQWVLLLKDQPLLNQQVLLKNIKDKLQLNFKGLWVIVCGPCVKDHTAIKAAYEVTNEMMTLSYLFNKEEILHYSQLSDLGDDLKKTSIMDWVYKISKVMINGSTKECEHIINDLFKASREEKEPMQLTITKYTQFYTLLIQFFQQQGHLEDYGVFTEEELKKLSHQTDHYHLQKVMREKLLKVKKEVQTKEQYTIATMVKQYIEVHYSRELKLEEIAQYLNYNSAYIGKQFKKETGVYYNTYLDQYRLTKGKELLLTSKMKVYEIARKVGYSDPDYFASKFKKYVGESPKAFRVNSISKV